MPAMRQRENENEVIQTNNLAKPVNNTLSLRI